MEKLEERWPLLKDLTISLFFLYFYIKGRMLGGSILYNRLEMIFGLYYYVLILYPLILGASNFIESKRKKTALKIRAFTGILFFFFCSFLFIIKELEPSVLTGTDLQQELVRLSWTELKLGGLSTTLMHYLYFNIERTYLYRILIGGIGVTSLILFTKSITNSIRGLIKLRTEHLERKELKKREEELKTKIKIKEEIDEKMIMKKEKNLKSHEEKIQQEVEKFMNKTSEKPEILKEEAVKDTVDTWNNDRVISLEELVEYARSQKAMADRDRNDTAKETDEISSEVSVEEAVNEEDNPKELDQELMIADEEESSDKEKVQ